MNEKNDEKCYLCDKGITGGYLFINGKMYHAYHGDPKEMYDEMVGMKAEMESEHLNTEKLLDGVYSERSHLVALVSKLFPATLEPATDCENDPDFNWIVYIDLPTGQVSWHVSEADLGLFGHLKRGTGKEWDGHDTDEKYRRVDAFTSSSFARFYEQASKKMMTSPLKDLKSYD